MPSPSLLRGSRWSSLSLARPLLRRPSPCPLPLPAHRCASSAPDDSPPADHLQPVAEPELLLEESDKPRVRRPRITTPLPKDLEPVEIPEGLNILWYPAGEEHDLNALQTALPPPEVFEDVLHNLHITLHPQTQHRAAYASTSGPPVEPTLGLYCPIEGGDYIVDATVKELARRTNAEVLVIDAVQLAAGEWGHFGKGANSLQLPRNPLHFSSPSSRKPPSRLQEESDVDEGEDFDWSMYPQPQQVALAVMAPAMQGRTLVPSPSRRPSSPPSKIKVFFDALVNTPSPRDVSSSSTPSDRPRLIYIRDFPTLAASSDVWYPPLLSAVRSRRRGPISRPSSTVANSMTIIFGMTPPLVPASGPGLAPEHGLTSVLMSRSSAQMSLPSNKRGRVDWGESEAAEKARERRLRDKLKRWEKSDTALHSEFPLLSLGNEAEEDGRQTKPNIIVFGGASAMSGLPSMLNPHVLANKSPSHDKSTFFRSSVLVPSIRSPVHEKATRTARRREINELTMRMGVGAIGGSIEESSFASIFLSEGEESSGEVVEAGDGGPPLSPSNHERMWEEWANKIELWSDVRKVADSAVGSVLSNGNTLERASLESTDIPWSAIGSAWTFQKANRDLRSNWLRDISLTRGLREEDQGEGSEEHTKTGADEVVERLKADNEIEEHEERLLSCIVNPVSIPTSFSQVHLPTHTIDSVRTIVSLPLLHPQAFKQGILKEHSMTGCLLFGPPGTGKTLVVRALAKEAGCRMLAISPSDIMDMYVGEGEKLVRAVFSLARKLSPCVVFLDEIDALFGARTSTRDTGGAFAHRGVITEFMQEMDGLKSSRDDSVIVIGATNRPFDLDDAVLRRLPRRLLVDLPGEKEREGILKILLRDEALATDVDVHQLARQTESFSGSDLKHLCVSAALDAVKEGLQLPWITTSSLPPPQTEPTKLLPLPALICESTAKPEAHSDGPLTELAATPPVETGSSTVIIDSAKEDMEASESKTVVPEPSEQPRVLHLRNFVKALKEITPSSSEALGSLAELRKWNEEFGEGRQDRKRQMVWGRGRFGFINHPPSGKADEGRVVSPKLRSQILESLDMQ